MRKSIVLILLTLILAACGNEGERFSLEGRFLHLDQGEFYIYSLSGGTITGLDTIKVESGRFAYEVECNKPDILVMVFPNFSEQPVFAEPGASVEMKADASHLKTMQVTGTDDNKLMNKFREAVAEYSPPQTVKFAEQFIKDHPESNVSVYLLRKYFLLAQQPDYKKVGQLLQIIQQKQPKNNEVAHLNHLTKSLQDMSKDHKLPSFKVYDINGKPVSSSMFKKGIGVITVWASWNYDSRDLQRQLKNFNNSSRGLVKFMSICVDPSRKKCREALQMDSVPWPTICDEEMINSPLLRKLGLFNIPDNIIIRNGYIIDRGLSNQELIPRLQGKI